MVVKRKRGKQWLKKKKAIWCRRIKKGKRSDGGQLAGDCIGTYVCKITKVVSPSTSPYTEMSSSHQCPYCPKALPTAQGLSSHLAQSQWCKRKLAAFYRDNDLPTNVHDEPYHDDDDVADQQVYDRDDRNSDLEMNPDVRLDPPIMVPMDMSDSSSEDEEDEEDDAWYIDDFAGAGLPHAERSQTNFEHHFEHQRKAGEAPWTPFESEDEWELARWLMSSGVSQKLINEFLKLNKVY
jgi:hypothetical protein